MRAILLLLTLLAIVPGCAGPDEAPRMAPSSTSEPSSNGTTNPVLPAALSTGPCHSSDGAPLADPLSATAPSWGTLKLTLAGKAGEWTWLYQPLAQSQQELTYSWSLALRAEQAAGPVAAAVQTPTLYGDNGGAGGPASFFLFPAVAVATGEAVAIERSRTPGSAQSSGPGWFGLYAGFMATTDWTATLSLEVGEGATIEQASTVCTGTGFLATVAALTHADPAAQDAQGASADLSAQGWAVVAVREATATGSREYEVDFNGTALSTGGLTTVRAGAVDAVGGSAFDFHLFPSPAGRVALTATATGTGWSEDAWFLLAPGLGAWLPGGFADYAGVAR